MAPYQESSKTSILAVIDRLVKGTQTLAHTGALLTDIIRELRDEHTVLSGDQRAKENAYDSRTT